MAPSAKRWVASKPQVGPLSMPIKDAEDQFVTIFNRERPELVEDAPHLDAIGGVRVASILGSDQQAVGLLTAGAQIRSVVMAISQDEADFGGHLTQQGGCRLAIGDIGGGQQSSDGEPHTSDDRDEMQFPAIHESMPPGFGPEGLRINRDMGRSP